MSVADKIIKDAVKDAQRILTEYVEPGPRNSEETINRLLDVLDSPELVAVIDESDTEEKPEDRSA